MGKLVFSIRKFVGSNISWFLETRKYGEHGRERAININTPVMNEWYPEGVPETTTRVSIRTKYFKSHEIMPELTDEYNTDNDRPIALQGGGKNWRLAGNAIVGEFYGTLKAEDLMLMMFDSKNKELSWMCIRSASNDLRTVPEEESQVYNEIIAILGQPNADRNMWLPSFDSAAKIIESAKKVKRLAGELLMELEYLHQSWRNDLKSSGIIFSENVLFTGLTGSGKTKLAQTFAYWVCENQWQYEIVSVGADWNSNENVMGYADALDRSRYFKTAILELILKANRSENTNRPFFLIMDEMNLSHVERYFADFLSSLESGEPINLHSDVAERDGVPQKVVLPKNLFIIGTVNVDETTYMFSPKVLDRANVLEFRVTEQDMDTFLNDPKPINLSMLRGKGAAFAAEFLEWTTKDIEFDDNVKKVMKTELMILFSILSKFGAEFGYRTAKEISRFISVSKQLAGADWNFKDALDAQVVQKVLPKLNGSRKKLECLLVALAHYCHQSREWDFTAGVLTNRELIFETAIEASLLMDAQLYPFSTDEQGNLLYPIDGAYLPVSYNKVLRMLNVLDQNGFVSFSEG
jgi:hypothetical protein